VRREIVTPRASPGRPGRAAGAPPPQVNGQQPRQGDHDFFLQRFAVGQPRLEAQRGFPVGLPAQEAMHGFDQDVRTRPLPMRSMLPSRRLPPLNCVRRGNSRCSCRFVCGCGSGPVADLAVERAEGEFAQGLGAGLIFHPRFDFGFEGAELLFDGEDEFAQVGQLGEHPGIEGFEFLPVARPHQRAGSFRGNTRRPGRGRGWRGHADFAPRNLPAAGGFAAALFGLGGDADGGEFVAVAIEPAGEAQAQGAGIELVGLARAVEGDGGDEEALRAGFHEAAVEGEAEAARLLHAEDLIAFGDPFFTCATSWSLVKGLAGRAGGVVFLHDGGDGFQVDVEAEFEHGFGGINPVGLAS
jgi:hypothetical protein